MRILMALLLLCAISAARPALAQEPAPALPDGVADEGFHFSKQVDGDFAATTASLRELLADAGFVILTEIDLQARIKAKLDKDIGPYLILGACNAGFAYEAYQIEPWIGDLLPCNFVIRELADGSIVVSVKNPRLLPAGTGNDELTGVSEQVTAAVLAVLDQL